LQSEIYELGFEIKNIQMLKNDIIIGISVYINRKSLLSHSAGSHQICCNISHKKWISVKQKKQEIEKITQQIFMQYEFYKSEETRAMLESLIEIKSTWMAPCSHTAS